MQLEIIGYVKNEYNEPADPYEMKQQESTLIIKEQFVDGLYNLAQCACIQVLFNFHQSTDYELKIHNYWGEYKGVFATRSPRRPSLIGVTSVELLKVEKNVLTVKGLDAINGTPILDIKPMRMVMSDLTTGYMADESLFQKQIFNAVAQKDWRALLSVGGSFHGHICPGLALGIKASSVFLSKFITTHINPDQEMKHYGAAVSTASCVVDGIQSVTNFTLGNNALTITDSPDNSITFYKKPGDAAHHQFMQLKFKAHFRRDIEAQYPDYAALFKKVVTEETQDTDTITQYRQTACKVALDILNSNPETLFEAV